MKNLTIFLFLLISTLNCFAESKLIKPFCTDGCTSINDLDPQFIHCCVSHDLAYYKGGTYQDKDKADANLRICVQQSSDFFDFFSTTFQLATSALGGEGETGWGYGWGDSRESKYHTPLKQQEIEIFNAATGHLNFIEMAPIKLASNRNDHGYMQKIYNLKCNNEDTP